MTNKLSLEAGLEPFPGYRLRQFLGRGAFAEVWEAEVTGGKSVALKFMSANTTSLAASKEVRSIQMVRKLSHPNLVRTDQVWCYGSYIVIAMELAEGDLNDLLLTCQSEQGTPIPARQVSNAGAGPSVSHSGATRLL